VGQIDRDRDRFTRATEPAAMTPLPHTDIDHDTEGDAMAREHTYPSPSGVIGANWISLGSFIATAVAAAAAAHAHAKGPNVRDQSWDR
jgi:hypothetical protein